MADRCRCAECRAELAWWRRLAEALLQGGARAPGCKEVVMTWLVYLLAGYGACLLLAWSAVKLADLCDRLIERMPKEAKR